MRKAKQQKLPPLPMFACTFKDCFLRNLSLQGLNCFPVLSYEMFSSLQYFCLCFKALCETYKLGNVFFFLCFTVFIHLTPITHQTSKKKGLLSNNNGNKVKEFTSMMIKSSNIIMSQTKYIQLFEFCFPPVRVFSAINSKG